MSLADLNAAQKEELIVSLSALLLQDSGVDMSAENIEAVVKVSKLKTYSEVNDEMVYYENVPAMLLVPGVLSLFYVSLDPKSLLVFSYITDPSIIITTFHFFRLPATVSLLTTLASLPL